MKRHLVLIVAALSLAAACSSGPPPEFMEGIVIDKVHTPESFVQIPVSCGPNCTTFIQSYEPPHYVIKVAWCAGDDCRVDPFDVEISTFEDLEKGDTYPRTAPAIPTTNEEHP